MHHCSGEGSNVEYVVFISFPSFSDIILRGCQMITELLDSNLSSQAINARTASQDKGPSDSNPPAFFFCWNSAHGTVDNAKLTS